MATSTKVTEAEAKVNAMDRALKRRNRRIKKLYIVCAVLAVLAVGGAVGSAIQYNQNKQLKDENAKLMNPEESAKAEMDRIKSKVEALVDTPKDETPIIATVTDIEKLKSQPFYANGQNGDKALFYEKAKRAILYRPSTDKIINTSTIDIKNTAPAEGQASPSPTDPAVQPAQ